jgi:transcriptional regulator with XRE-family HTH domain
MNVGDKLRQIRKEQKLTLRELNNLTNISISFLSDIENRRRNPSIDTLKIISKALNVEVSYFLDEDSSSTKNNNILDNFPMVPKHFTDPEEARKYVMKHQIFAYGGFNPAKMSDEDILNFANEMINQAELLGLKYSIKNKNK